MGLEWSEYLALVCLGFGTGLYSVLVGAGGGFILAPLLIIVWGLEPSIAAGSSVAVVWINSLSGSHAHYRQRRIDVKRGLLLGVVATPGSIIGALIVRWVSAGVFDILFGVMLLLVSVYLFQQSRARSNYHSHTLARVSSPDGSGLRSAGTALRYRGIATLGFPVGIISGFFGVGGGFLLTPALVYIFKVPIHIATATAIFSLVIFAGVGALTHLILGHILLSVFIPAALGAIVGGQLGAYLSEKLQGVWIVRILVLGLMAVSVRLMILGVGV